MKKILTIITSVLAFNLNAQCVRDISSNPQAPKNDEFENLYPSTSYYNPFVNTFNWGANTGISFNPIALNPNAGWQINGFTGGPFNMENPFSSNLYDYIYRPIGSSPNQKDWHWENGWELMWLNTGYFPNGDRMDVNNAPYSNPNGNNRNSLMGSPIGYYLSHPKIPYFVLYNKYTRTLRVFFSTFTDIDASSFNDIRIELNYKKSDNVSGILRHVGEYDLPLDQTTLIYRMMTTTKAINNSNKFMSTDFKLGYDPCVCEIPSLLNFYFRGVSNYNISLYGRSVSMTQSLVDNNGNPRYDDFLNQSEIDNSLNNNSNLLYKSMDNLITSYQTQLDQYNTDKTDYNRVENMLFRSAIGVVKTGITSGLGGYVPSKLLQDYLLSKQLKIKALGNTYAVPTAKDAEDWSNQLKSTFKSELGKHVEQLSMQLFGNSLTSPQPPSMPMATFTEMRIQGTMDKNTEVYLTNLYSPGSYQPGSSLNPEQYPIWNNATGLYAMLHTPKLNLYKKNNSPVLNAQWESYDNSNKQEYNEGDELNSEPKYNNARYKYIQFYYKKFDHYFKISDKVVYKLNDAVDINKSKSITYALFQIEIQSDYFGSNPPLKLGNYTLLTGDGNKYIYTSDWYPMETLGEATFGFTHTSYEAVRRNLRTDIKVYDYNTTEKRLPYYEHMNELPGYSDLKIKKIKMKVMTDLYFNQKDYNQQEINSTDVYSYLMFDEDKGIDLIQQYGTYTDVKTQVFKYHPGELHLNGAILTSQWFLDNVISRIVGNTIFIEAEKIYIDGSITAPAGFNVEIVGKDFVKTAENPTLPIVIGENITIYIKDNYFNFGPNNEVDASYLTSYCNLANNLYKANVANSILPTDLEDSLNAVNGNETRPVRINVYPNPSGGIFNVSITNLDATECSFKIFDNSGRCIINEKLNCSSNPTFEVDLSNYADGFYFAEISYGKDVFRSKIIKNSN